MTLLGVAGNLLVAALLTWVVFDLVLGLATAGAIVVHAGRWRRAGLLSRWRFVASAFACTVREVRKPVLLLLGAASAPFFLPSFASWLGGAWGPWAGATLGLVGATHHARTSLREAGVRAATRAHVYARFEKDLPPRPTIRQQTFLKPYRQAHEEEKPHEQDGGEQTGRAGPSPE